MPFVTLFSRRSKAAPDVFRYDHLPKELRAQIVHILQDTVGPHYRSGEGWRYIAKLVAKEHGLLALPGTQQDLYGRVDHFTICLNYVLQAEFEHAIDLVEVCFRMIENERGRGTLPGDGAEAIAELNARFRQHGCGFHFESGKIVRVDSQVLHAEAVVPALTLLRSKGFEGPEKEFLSAHEHFRHGRAEEAVTDACKAFESTMKAICTARRFPFDPKATASPLIRIMIDKEIVPRFSEEQLENVAKCLIGVATVRNKTAGHGAGAKRRELDDHFAAYAIHLAASNIVFLAHCHHAKK